MENIKGAMAGAFILKYLKDKAWYITPEYLDTILDIVNSHIIGSKIDIGEIESQTKKKLNNTYEPNIINGTAIIPIHGTIAKRMNFFHEVSGGVSTQLLKRDIGAALDNPKVEKILLDIDSPGGEVSGTKELADFIFESRGNKPIISYASGDMCSAALYIGVAADRVVAAEDSMVGSIGVVLAHIDYSEAYKQRGIKKTYIAYGKYKRIANEAEPLSREGEDYLFGIVKKYGVMFEEDVAKYRGVSVEAVRRDMGDARLFIGDDALKAGLVDEIGTLDSLIGDSKVFKITAKKEEGLFDDGAGETVLNDCNFVNTKQGGKTMTLEDLKSKHGDLLSEHFVEKSVHNTEISTRNEKINKLSDELETSKKGNTKLNDTLGKSEADKVDFQQKLEAQTGMVKVAEGYAEGLKKEYLTRGANAYGDAWDEKAETAELDEKKGKALISHLQRVIGNMKSLQKTMKAHIPTGRKSLGGDDVEDSIDTTQSDIKLGQQLARAHSGKIRSDG